MNKMQDLPLCDLNEVKRTAKRTDSDMCGQQYPPQNQQYRGADEAGGAGRGFPAGG